MIGQALKGISLAILLLAGWSAFLRIWDIHRAVKRLEKEICGDEKLEEK